MANKTGSHQNGDISTTMRSPFGEKLGPRGTKGLIDADQEDDRSGRFPTKNCLDIGGKPATLEGPQGTALKFRK